MADSGESFRRIDLLAETEGCRLVLKRVSQKQGGVVPDLFDTADVTLGANKQNTVLFIREYALLHRRSGIGRSYGGLRAASLFCALLADNAPLMDDAPALLGIAERALDAFAEKEAPDTTLLKALYLLLRHEGYPVREQWWAELPRETRETVRTLLNQPVDGPAGSAPADSARRAGESLLRWVRHQTELRVPETG